MGKNLKLAILGNGRAGKDTCGAWFGEHTNLKYVGSTSEVVCPLIAQELGISPEEAWNSRHNNRQFWYEWCNEYRKEDPAKLAKYCLSRGDMVVGLRDKIELYACKEEDLFDLIIWVDRDVPEDKTVTFSREDCDIMISNRGSFEELYGKLARLAKSLGLDSKD